jgi:hypothetical protein
MWLQEKFNNALGTAVDSLLGLVGNKEALVHTRMHSNIRRYGSRSVDCYDLARPRRPLNATEVRGLATGGILAFYNDDPIRVLPPLTPEGLAGGKESLAQWWGITNTEQAIERLERLQHTGHRQELRPQLKSQPKRWNAVFEANPFLEKRFVTSIAAWDYARMVNVARWSYDYGYLSWEQAWHYINAATRLALLEFDSWDSFATSFVAGRLMWNPDLESHAEIAKLTTFLVESPASPWRSIPWQPYPVS